MKKLTVVAVTVLAALLVLAACTSAPAAQPSAEAPSAATTEQAAPATEAQTEASGKVADNKDVVIGFNQGSATVDFLKKVGDSIEKEAKAAGTGYLYAESNFDAEKIIPSINTLLMQGANVIVDFNVNAEMGGNIVQVCEDKGVHVIGIDVQYTAPDGKTSWFMGANNQQAGEVAGKALAAAAKTKFGGALDAVILFYNSENGDEVKKRVGGVIDGLKAEGITVPEEDVEWIDLGGGGADSTVPGKDKFTGWLTANPDKHKIGICTVNDQTAQGVFSAIQTSARDKDCLLVSHGCDEPAIANLRLEDNCWIGSVGYFPERYGEYIVPLAISLAKGENPEKQVLMNHLFVDKTNVDEYYPAQ